MSKRSKDRREARRAAHEADKKRAEEEGGTGRRGPLVPEAALDELGLKQWRPVLGRDDTEGLFAVRFVPFNPSDPDRLAFPMHVHYNVGPDSDAYLCPILQTKAMEELGMKIPDAWDGRCPECEEYERELQHYKEVKDGLGEEERKKAYAKVSQHGAYSGGFVAKKPNRMLAFVVDTTAKDSEDEGLQAWDLPYPSVFVEGMLEQDEDSETGEFVDLNDPEEEIVFLFKKVKTGPQARDVRYRGYKIKKRPWRLKADELEDILDGVPRLSEVLKIATYEEMAQSATGLPNGKAGEDQPEEDKREAEEDKNSRRSRRRRRAAEDDPDENPKDEPKPETTEDEGRADRLRRRRKLREQAKRRAEESGATDSDDDPEDRREPEDD